VKGPDPWDGDAADLLGASRSESAEADRVSAPGPDAAGTASPVDLRGLLEAAVDIAWRAGRSTLDCYQAAPEVEAKADGSPVTVADRNAERIARELIAARFPADGILGEEQGETGAGAARQWVLDPIDGTRTFVRGVPFFGFLLGLVVAGDPVLGVAYFPALGETLAAARGCGCWWNGNRAKVSSVARLDEALVAITDVENAERLGRGAAWDRLRRRAGLARTWGDCYGYALVATGRAEVMLDPVLAPWDILPFVPILAEAGGVLTSWPASGPMEPAAVGGASVPAGSAVATNLALDGEVRALLAAEQAP
jgi:histidinol-phosphatase